jgi:RHS repeat-associated protein
MSISSGFKDTLGRTAVSWTGFGKDGDQVSVSGLSSNITLHWATVPVTFPGTIHNVTVSDPSMGTKASCSLGTSPTSSINVVAGVDLPNGQNYTFSYDPNYGRVSKIKFGGGGYVRYVWGLNTSSTAAFFANFRDPQGNTNYCDIQYDTPAVADRYVSYDGSTEVLHQHFAYSTTWNSSQPWIWTGKTTTVTTTDLVTNQTAVTVYNYTPVATDTGGPYDTSFGNVPSTVPVEDSVVYQDGTGHTLKTSNKKWLNVYVSTGDQTILDNGQGAAVLRCYDSNEQLTNVYEYGFQSEGSKPADPSCVSSSGLNTSAIGPLRRSTAIAYHNFLGASPSTHILNAPASVTIYDGSGNRAKQTTIAYSESVVSSGTATGLVSPPGLRGNATTISRWLNTSGSSVTTTFTYFDTGTVKTTTDPCGNSACSDVSGTTHTTTYYYTDNYSSCRGSAPPTGVTNAYVTTISDPLGHAQTFCYGYNDGQLRGSTDPNTKTTTYTYNDSLARLTETDFPDGGRKTIAYNDTPPTPTVTTTILATPDPTVTSVSLMDGVGHVTQTQLTSDVQTDYTTKTYDGLGRTYKAYNPTRCSPPTTNCGESTWGYTTYTYDALGRTTKIADPDRSSMLTSYSGNCTTVTDEAGKSRQSCTDGLGRLTQLTEDPGSSPHFNYLTTYTYDPLDDLTGVVQNGSRPRTFVYNSLSQLTSATNPESGTINYTYDANGNLVAKIAPLPKQTGTATVTTTYAYDADNRLLSKTYSDGTPTATFTYDVSSIAGLTGLTNPVGRLVQASNSNAQTVTSYDPMGRIKQQWQCTPINCGTSGWFTFTYGYDFAGQQTSINPAAFGCQSSPRNCYNGGFTLSQTFDSAGRVNALTSNLTDLPLHPPTLVSGVTYDPAGQITAMTYGNKLTEARAYNTRLQPCHLNLNSSGGTLAACTSATPAGNIQDFVYHYNLGVADNGDITWTTGTGQQSFYRTYTYDSLNRLSSMADSDSSQVCKGLSWTYDAWGNRTAQILKAGACRTFSVAVNTNNQFVGLPYQYDAAGNMTHDASHSYSYDAEGHIIKVDGGSTATYVYDANGRRIEQLTPLAGYGGAFITHFWYDTDGRVRTIWDQNGGWIDDYLYLGSEEIGHYSTLYNFKDILGSTRVLTKPDQTVQDSEDYLPFGEQEIGRSWSLFKFTGKERDAESGLDNFIARYDSSSLGRFMSADDTAPEDHKEDPQGLNLYSYVENNPINATDPDGHDCVFVLGNTAGLQRGDCSNAPNNATNVTYVPGTVDAKSAQYNPETRTLTVNYTPYGDTGSALAVIGGVTPTHPGPTEFEAFASRIAAGADNVNAFAVQVGIQVGAGALGRAIGAGIESVLAARAAKAAEAVVDLDNLTNKIVRRMTQGGWTKQDILDAIKNGKAYDAANKATGGAATEYVTSSGKFVVIDNTTKQVLQVSRPGQLPNYLVK